MLHGVEIKTLPFLPSGERNNQKPQAVIRGLYIQNHRKIGENVATEIGENILLDYLSFTLPFFKDMLEKIPEVFGTDPLDPIGYGGMGYTESATILDGGRVYWHPDKPEMGIHVRLPGSSLSLTGFTALGILNQVINMGGRIVRLDIAFDDLAGLLDMDEMYQKLLAGSVVTRFRKVARIQGVEIGQNRKIGDTVNVGVRTSHAFVRIYDKKREQEAKGRDVAGIESWTRVELELKSQKAHMFGKLLADSVYSTAEEGPAELSVNLLWGLLDFKEIDPDDQNKSRWDTSEWWQEFLQAERKLMLSIPQLEKTINDAKRWLHDQVAPTLAMVMLSLPDDNDVSGYDFIMDSVAKGEDRLSKAQQKRLKLYNDEQARKRNKK